MNTRSSRSTVTFFNPFSLSGYSGELPAGDYEVIVEEDLLQGNNFVAWRRTATYLTVCGRGSHAGRTEMRATTNLDLNAALSRDQAATQNTNDSDAALFPQEDMK